MYTCCVKGVVMTLETSPEVFSPSGIDPGTLAMLNETDFPDGMILDLGCGCGVVGICAAKLKGMENVVMCDISEKAAVIAKENAERNGVAGVRVYVSDGFKDFDETGFAMILSHPPYHTDFKVAKHFIEEGYKRLLPGGRMVMVTKRLEWYKNKLTSVFGGVKISERDGYFIFTSEKRAERSAAVRKRGMSKKLLRKYGK